MTLLSFSMLRRWAALLRQPTTIGMSSGFGGCVMILLESALGYGMAGHLAGTHCLRNMHGDGVTSWNGVVYGARFGTLFFYIIPRGVPVGYPVEGPLC